MINVIFNDFSYEILPKRLELFDKYNKIIQWGRKHPTRFIEDFFKINLTDHQTYILLSSWYPANVVWLMGRNSGKSFLAAPFMMARAMLLPNTNTYIMAPSGGQSQETFQKMEDMAKGNIASLLGTTSVFLEQCVRQNAAADPFTHPKSGYTVSLYNGSTINTLNSNVKTIVGIRSNFSVYDEAGKIDRDFFALTKPFTAQDTNFITGEGINTDIYPLQLPNKKLLLSSAERISSELFDSYKMAFNKMLLGDPEYFVCDISCEFSLHPMMHGKPMRPLIRQDEIDAAFATNPYKAQREYLNIFDKDGGEDVFVKRSTILKYSDAYYPIFENEGGKLYIIAYDPSTKLDNSVITIAELIDNEEKGLMVKLVNCINLIEMLPNGEKAIIQKPEQIEILKDTILNYNLGAVDYENIDQLILDAGAGGGGMDIAQFLLNEWKGKDGRLHRGFIDINDPYMQLRENDYQGNATNLTMFNFKRDKAQAYERTQTAINQGLVIFPKSLNAKGEMELEEVSQDGQITVRYEKVNFDEMNALIQIDLLKEEAVGMQKVKKPNGTIVFETSPDGKQRGLHDDRIDTLCMICDRLMQLRAERALALEEKPSSDFKDMFAKVNNGNSAYMKKVANTFATQGGNPFVNRRRPN